MVMIDKETGEIVTPFLRTAYNYDTDAASMASGQENNEPSMTQQNFKDEVDINTIVERFGLTGKLPDDLREPSYGDYTEVEDFQTAMNAVIKAKEEFMKLPGNIRARFENDPQQYLEFFDNPDNRDEAISLGLVKPKTALQDTQPTAGQGGTTPATKESGAADT